MENIDALVAMKVFGWNSPDEQVTRDFWSLCFITPPPAWREFWLGYNEDGSRALMKLKPWSADIAAAWQVVEKVMAAKSLIDFSLHGDIRGRFTVKFTINGTASAETAPLAICLAALNAVGAEGIKIMAIIYLTQQNICAKMLA